MSPEEVRALIPSYIENSEIHVCAVTDIQGDYLYVNQLFKKRFSFITQDFIGTPSPNTYHPDDFQKSLQAVMECFANPDKVVNLQLRKPTAISGKYLWTDWEFSAFHNDKKEVIGVFCLGHDISEKERGSFIEKKYFQNTQAIIENLTDGFLILNKVFEVTAISQVILNTIQPQIGNYVGKLFFDLLPHHHSFDFVSKLKEANNNSTVITLEEYFPQTKQWYSIIIFPNPEGLTVYFQDISQEKRNIEALERTQNLLNETGKITKIGGWEYNVLTHKLFWTEETYSIHKIDQSFVPNAASAMALYHPEHQAIIREAFSSLLKDGKSYDLELKLITANQKESWVRTIGKAVYENGKIVKLSGIIQDINDEKEQEDILKISQERLQILADNVPGAIFQYVLYPDGTDEIPFINIGSEQVWEVSPEEVMKDTNTIWSTILPEFLPSLQESVNESAENQSIWSFQYQIQTPSGKIKWLKANGVPQGRKADGALVWHTLVVDITDSKAKENELSKTKKLLDEVGQIAQIGGWEYDVRSGKLTWTEETFYIHELDFSYTLNIENAIAFYHPNYQSTIQRAFNNLLQNGEPFDLELKIITAKKNEIWVGAKGKAIIEGNKIVRLLGTLQNIDARKKQEKIIKDTQSRLNLLADNVSGAILQYKIYSDGTDAILYINASCIDIWEMTAEEIKANISQVWDMIYPEDLELFQLSLEESSQNQTLWSHQWRITTPSGKFKWLEVSGVPQKHIDGVMWNSVITDISERKEKDEELRKTKNLLLEVGKMAKIGGWEYDVQTQQSFWTDETFRIYELESPTVPEVEKGITFYHSDYQQVIADAFNKLLSTGKPYDLELKFITAKQKEIWVRSMGKAIYKGSQIIKLLGTFQDIDDRKKQEEVLKINQERLNMIADNVPGAIFQYTVYSNGLDSIPYINIGCQEIWELSPEEIMKDATPLWEMVLPEYLEPFRNSVIESAKKQTFWSFEWQIRTPSGKVKWLKSRGHPQGWKPDGSLTWHTLVLDITEQKLIVEKIKYSQQKLSAILNNAIDSNILIDLDYKVLTCNRIAKEDTKKIMGREMREGDDFRDFLAFFDQKISDVFYQAFDRALKGESVRIEEEFDVKSKSFTVWYHYQYDTVYSEDGEIIGVSLTSTNIDQRKKAEEKVLEQNERLKEIAWVQSHKVRHPLANILGLVNLLKNDPEASPELKKQIFDYLFKASKQLDEIIHEVVEKSEEIEF